MENMQSVEDKSKKDAELNRLSSLIASVYQEIEKTDDNKFNVPQPIIDDFNKWIASNGEYNADTDDLRQFLNPNAALAQFQTNAGIEEAITKGDIRNVYLIMFQNLHDKDETKLVEDLDKKIKAMSDNNDLVKPSVSQSNAGSVNSVQIQNISASDAQQLAEVLRPISNLNNETRSDQSAVPPSGEVGNFRIQPLFPRSPNNDNTL